MSSHTEQLNIDYERWIKKLQKSLDEDEKIIYQIEQDKKDLIENNISLKQEILNLKKEVNTLKKILREKDKYIAECEKNIVNLEEIISKLRERIKELINKRILKNMEQSSVNPVDILIEGIDVTLDRFINHFKHNIEVKPPDTYNDLYRAKRRLAEIKAEYINLKDQYKQQNEMIQSKSNNFRCNLMHSSPAPLQPSKKLLILLKRTEIFKKMLKPMRVI